MRTKQQIIAQFNLEELTYIDAILELESIGYSSTEAESIIEDAFEDHAAAMRLPK